MTDKIYTESFRVKSYHVDFRKELKSSSFLRFFQEIAGNHASKLQFGYDQLTETKMFWVLSRIQTEIIKPPMWGDTLHITTWPVGVEKVFFRRDFEVRNQDDELVIRGTSGWLLLNATNLRPQRPAALGDKLVTVPGKFALPTFPDRIKTEAMNRLCTKTVEYGDIDMNMHVNNTRYMDWVGDCLKEAHYQCHRLTSFTLEFLSETHWNEAIELNADQTTGNRLIEAVRTADNKAVFRAALTWVSIPEEA